MQIIILGAGQVGGSLAANLAAENHSITVIDTDEEHLNELQDRFDLRTVLGHCSYPSVLAAAGAENADMIIAVTDNDESNMLACQVAYTLFKIPFRIARIRARDYLIHEELFGLEALPIDVFISPEQLVTNYIRRLVENPGALRVLDFSDGQVKLVVLNMPRDSSLLGKKISELPYYLPDISANCVALFRAHHWISITPNTHFEIGDEVFFVTASQQVRPLLRTLGHRESSNKYIMIAGGGNIGSYLAKTLELDYKIKLIERNRHRCEHLSQQLNNSIILYGSACDTSLLNNENIETIDVFCALTNDDEDNIIACLQAKKLGAKQVIALVNRPAYLDLIESGTINVDIAISPQLVTAGSILTHLRRGNMVNVYSVHQGAAEAIEVIAHGDPQNSQVIGRTLAQLNLPHGIAVGAIVRHNKVIIAQDAIIQPEDHVILFITEKKLVPYLEQLFDISHGLL